MCNLSEGVWQRGIEQGIEQGIKKDRREILFSMQSKGLSVDEIANYTCLSIPEVRAVLEEDAVFKALGVE